MIEQFILICTAIIFYFLGYYAGRYHEIKHGIRKIIKKLNTPVGQLIDYPTPEQAAYYGSEQEKIDKDQERLIREAGIGR